MSVRIYVEGGGHQPETLTRCRVGFSQFVAKVVRKDHMPKIIASGSRDDAFNDFCTAIRTHPRDMIVLLVDSEDEIIGTDCWAHVMTRDRWNKPAIADERNLYLMVRSMESWFLTDKGALQSFYSTALAVNKLPGSVNVESVSKRDVKEKLDHITGLVERKYHKTQHGFKILASLDPHKVAQGSVHAKRFIDFLQSL